MRSRDEEGGDRKPRDLIEAGLSEPAGWRVLLWGLCLWRRVRGARSAEARQDLDGRSVIGGVDGSRQIDAGNVVLGSTAAMVRQCRIAAVPANATYLLVKYGSLTGQTRQAFTGISAKILANCPTLFGPTCARNTAGPALADL